MQIDCYQTIAGPSEGLFKDKGSKFLSSAFPVKNEDQIKEIIDSLRKEHFSARHCCYAWSLGREHEKFRFNDDGEPSGTAGRPIYGQIQSHKLTNILVVVIRYFGGTLLGVSGLIQAYKSAACDAIVNAHIVTKNIEHSLEIEFDYLSMNDIMLIIKEEQLEIVKANYALNCSIELIIRSALISNIISRLSKIDGVRTKEKIIQ